MTKIIGILNLTLDSFSDGGMYYDLESAKKHISEMLDQGAATFVQDENTSVVWGMPGSAAKIGAVQKEVPLEKVASELIKFGRE